MIPVVTTLRSFIATGCGRSQTSVANYTDACSGLSSTATTTYTWTSDLTGPIGSAPTGLPVTNACIVNALTSVPAFDAALVEANYSDACGSVTASLTNTTLAGLPCNWTVTYDYVVTDPCGNTTTGSYVHSGADLTGPTFSALPAPTAISCPAVPIFPTPSITDACGTAVMLSPVDYYTTGACAGTYTVTRVWSATDDCGNISTTSQQISVVDNTAPTISALPPTSTIGCPATPSFATPTVSDLCDANPSLTFSDASTPACFSSYSVTRTWLATDACGNTATATQTINVVDMTGPVFDPIPGVSTITCPATPSFITPNAIDACGSTVTITNTDAVTPGSCAGSYSVTRTWVAMDDCGNSTTASQTINVQDVTGPVFGPIPAPTYVNCPAGPVFITATATDGCGSGAVITSYADAITPGGCAGTFTATRTWIATDACGNTTTASQTIIVQDITGPAITQCAVTRNIPGIDNSAITGPSYSATSTASSYAEFANATNQGAASEECTSIVSVSYADAVVTTCPRVINRTWTLTDGCGNSSNCVQTINVIYSTPPTSFSATACDSYTWAANGNTSYTTTGSYAHTFVNAAGCDSVVTLNLTVNYSSTSSTTATACDSYTWADNGATYTATGTYTHTSMNMSGCVNTATLNLTVNYSSSSSESATACNSYTWAANGATYTQGGTYTATSTNVNGCVHTTTLNLTVNYSSTSSTTATACDTYTWSDNGATYTATGTYTYTSMNMSGCVNTATLNLTVNYSSTSSTTATACDAYIWADNGATYTATGTYTYTSMNMSGCVNTATLNLTVNYSSSSSVSATACDSYTWAANGATYTQSGSYTATSLNTAGCVHTTTLNLTVNYSSTSSTTATACDSYIWADNGATYTATGTYTYTSMNMSGCVNTATLNLTVNYSSTSSTTATACDSYTWSDNGATYTTSGTYTYTSMNMSGCVNTATLNLTVNYSSSNTTTTTACDTYTWAVNGLTYTANANVVVTSLNSFGCTHTETLNLTVNYSTSSSETATAALSYTWPVNGATYTLGGTYTATTTNLAGCPHVTTLNLTITGVTITTKVLLDGPYVGGGLMHDSLRSYVGLIPSTEPYSSAPYNKATIGDAAGETTTPAVLAVTGNNAIVDWIFLELRNTTAPFAVVATKRALLQRDGDVVDVDGLSPVTFSTVLPGNYRVSVKHRNHLGVMTNLDQALTLGGSTVDFTTAPLYVKPALPALVNTPAKVSGGLQILWSGDARNDRNSKYNGFQNDKEFILIALGSGGANSTLSPVYRREDVNMDSKIRYNGLDNDRNVILGTVGAGTPNAIYNQHTPD
ncbi:MAG: hypothetical protein IPI46_01290 [Bacteroidetes bacterium]|nr:hypothetical protein [Bacteroidota bacterium]